MNKKDLVRYLGKKWIIALLLTVPFLFFLPRQARYKTILLKKGKTNGEKMFYDDLNGDGNSEKITIRTYTKLNNVPSIYVQENGKFLYEWITSGDVVSYKSSITGDYDHDDLKEVYLVTCSNDSVFLHGVIPFKKEVLFTRKFLSRFSLYQGNNELSISDMLMADLTGDGFNEVVIFMYSSFAYTNRKVIAYDIRNDTLLFSPESCWQMIWEINLYDWDKDSLPEITGGFPAWGNCTASGYPFTDSLAWLMVLDNDLSFLFKPVPVGTYSSEVHVVPYKYGNKAVIAVLYKQNGINDSSFIALYSSRGELLTRKYISLPDQTPVNLFSDPEQDFRELYFLGPETEQLDSSLSAVRRIDLPYVPMVFRLDVDGDGENEYILLDKTVHRFVICRKGFRYPAVIDIPLHGETPYFSLIKEEDRPVRLFLLTPSGYYELYYKKNIFYFLQWLIFPVIFFLLYLIIYGIERLQQARLQQRFDDERRIIELQIKAVKNQIDPHFTLNMVNTIGSLFSRKETDRANEMFTRYARMLQSTISSSDNVSTSLREELEYVRNYLAIQQFRMENKFTFHIRIPENIIPDKIKIPKMLVYTFVENAIKHGISPLKEKGEIDIAVQGKYKSIIIMISDNGVGRSRAKEHPGLTTGKGLKILDEMIDLFYKLENIRIRYELKDGHKGGTVATVYISG